MEQFNQNGSNDQSNYDSNNQNNYYSSSQNQPTQNNTNVNSNGAGAYSDNNVKQYVPYNAINANSYNFVQNNPQNKKQLQKRQELINGLIAAGVVCAVLLVVFTVFKGPREFIGGVATRVSWLFQGRDKDGVLGDYAVWSRKELEGNGLHAYNPVTDKDKFDENGFERDLNIPEDYLSASQIVVETSAEKGQLGPILKNDVVNNDIDEDSMDKLYKSYCKVVDPDLSYDRGENFFDDSKNMLVSNSQLIFLKQVQDSNFMGYNALCDDEENPRNSGLVLIGTRQNVLRQDGSSVYVDKDGNPVTLSESAHRDSLISVAWYMLYKQGFARVQVTPGGVVGIGAGFHSTELQDYDTFTEVVVPSKTDPNKFDLYIDAIYMPNGKKYLGDDGDFNEEKGNRMIGELPIEQVNILRNKNKHLMPFRIVAHNVERPFAVAKGQDSSEIDEIVKNFKIK